MELLPQMLIYSTVVELIDKHKTAISKLPKVIMEVQANPVDLVSPGIVRCCSDVVKGQ